MARYLVYRFSVLVWQQVVYAAVPRSNLGGVRFAEEEKKKMHGRAQSVAVEAHAETGSIKDQIVIAES